MRVTSSLNIPDELERARSAGELVLFAGAGVSMGPPANMPGFGQLARYAAGPGVPYDEKRYQGKLDEYLGEAMRHGVLVHERARDRLDPGDREHTPMHEHLLGLFGVHERVRLITTNFEDLFTKAARVVYPGAPIPHYFGPALPPGDAFTGIAHLHGARLRPESKLVLTDEDFAKAYLSNGWATRFLVDVFAGRTVLFVGYSLSDPVIQYVLRAIAPTGRWYALARGAEQMRWKGRGIQLLTFAAGTNGNEFGELHAGIARWRWYAQAPAIDHDKELRRILDGGPPSSPLDADYLRARLKTEPGRETFWKAAVSVEWLQWAANEKYLDSLTDPSSQDPDLQRWAHWCLDNFMLGDNPALLGLLRTRGPMLHPFVARLLAMALSHDGGLAKVSAARQFVAAITTNPASLQRGEEEVWLLEKLIAAGRGLEALALLRANTAVRLGSTERYLMAAFEADAGSVGALPALSTRVVLSGDSSDLGYYLERSATDLAKLAAAELLALGIQRISEAYELLDLARASEDAGAFDWFSYGRTSIAPSNQDHNRHAVDILVLIVRCALDELSSSDPEHAFGFAVIQSRAGRVLLKRLALYAFAKLSTIPADELLDRGRAEGWARQVFLRPELYLVLGVHYRRASEAAKSRFVADLQDDSWWGEEFDEHDAHARFSLAQMLTRMAPDSTVTSAFAAAERAAHPTFAESDADGYLTRIEVGWGGDGPSPISPEEMVKWSPEDAVRLLVKELKGSDVVS